MKTIIILSITLLAMPNIFAQTQRAMTYNIRFDNPNDGDNRWDNRKAELVGLIQSYTPNFLGVQEAMFHQLQYIQDNLTNYTYIGVGRDDGKQKGEFSAIFYDSTKYNLLTSSTFWLSEYSDFVSVGWDASMERICTFGLFEHQVSGQKIWVFNTHFDHIGKVARQESAKLILEKIKTTNTENYPLILMGDFNALPNDKPIKILSKQMADAFKSSPKITYKNIGTFNGFKIDEAVTKRIDYIFTKKITVISYQNIEDKRQNNLQISDHFPVLIEFEVK
jgi:endonuclease/exonuclease/phosphatase family metal-dependent hydrolase